MFSPPFAISPDGRALAVARLDGRVDLLDAETLRRTGGFAAFDGRSAVAIEYAPDGRHLAVAGAGGGVGVWDAGSGRRLGPLLRAPRGPVANNPHTVQAVAFGPDGLLAAAEVGGAVRVWDVGRRELAGPPLSLPPSVLGLAFSPDGSRLAIPFGAVLAKGGDGVEVRNVESGQRVARLPVDGEVRAVAFSPDGGLLAGGQLDGAAVLWATDGWQRVGAPLALREATALAVDLLPRRPHARELARRRRGRTLGRPLAAADRFAPCAPRLAARAVHDGTLHPRREPAVRGPRRRARVPMGGRPCRLAPARLRRRRPRPHSRAVGEDRARAGLHLRLPLALTTELSAGPTRRAPLAAWIFGVDSERAAGRHACVGHPELDWSRSKVPTDMDVPVARIDERLPGRD